MNLMKDENLINVSQAAKLLDIKIQTLWNYAYRYHLIPAPATQSGKRMYYSKDQFEVVKQKINDLRERKAIKV